MKQIVSRMARCTASTSQGITGNDDQTTRTKCVMATYVLLIKILQNQEIDIGARGRFFLRRGSYLYVGSARKNWQKRVARHCRKEKKKRWHIDYILTLDTAFIETVWVCPDNRECPTCRSLIDLAETRIPAPRIGASDCRCPAHFLQVETGFSAVEEKLQQSGFLPLTIRSPVLQVLSAIS
ncbi:MAG: GIY-YIG nuclease family protein [Magnetococcales bacterium]|nr:GIY-YIG nuclease family protein [Magnetococcales bacterium]